MAATLRKDATNPFSARDAYQQLKGSRGLVQTMEPVVDALKLLELHGHVCRVPLADMQRKGGRHASPTWQMNPKVFQVDPPDPPEE